MEYNKVIDQKNIEIFNKKGLNDSNEYRHKCVLCGNACNIDRSISHHGERLICNDCARKKFKSLLQAFQWIEGLCEE